MKPERIQSRSDRLDGWVLVKGESRQIGFAEREPFALKTAFEMADHYEACELVAELGQIADACCICPEIDVRRNVVYVTVKHDNGRLREADFDFAEAVDDQIGTSCRAHALIARSKR